MSYKTKKNITKLIFWMVFLGVIFSGEAKAEGQPAELCKIINKLKEALQYIGGGVAVVCTIVAGLLFLTSTGNPQRMGVGKLAILGVVVGVVLLIIAGSVPTIANELFGSPISTC